MLQQPRPLVCGEDYSFEMKDGFVVTGEPGFVLEPYDEIYVRKSPGYVGQEHVLVDGEVAFAGTYVLTRKNYRLSDLINAAGGINEQAYIGGAKLIRKMSEEEKKKIPDHPDGCPQKRFPDKQTPSGR